MQNKFTIAVKKLFTPRAKRAPFVVESVCAFSSKASPFLDKGALFLSAGKAHNAKSSFETALKTAERELQACTGEYRNTLLHAKGEALLGLGKAQAVLQEGDSLAEVNEKASNFFTGAIDAFDSAGDLKLKAEALELRSTVQGGRLKSALDDLYAAFQIYKSLPDQGCMEGAAFSFVDISISWGEAPYYEKALEMLSALSSENKKVAEKTSEIQCKLGDVSAPQKINPSEPSLDDINSILSKINGMIASGQIDLNDPRFANEGVSVVVDGLDKPVLVRKEIPENFRNIPLSNRPDGWEDRAFMARLENNRPLPKILDYIDAPAMGKSHPSDLKLQAMRLDVQGDNLSKTDKNGALQIYLRALELYKKSAAQNKDALVAELARRIEEKIISCGGTV